MMARASRRFAMVAWLYQPCFVRAALMRSMLSAVLAPVDMPPCILHRPFGIAADRQGVPLRVLAPHLGALCQSPWRLPFLSGLQESLA